MNTTEKASRAEQRRTEQRISTALGMQESAERQRDKAERGRKAAQADNVRLREQLAEARAVIETATVGLCADHEYHEPDDDAWWADYYEALITQVSDRLSEYREKAAS